MESGKCNLELMVPRVSQGPDLVYVDVFGGYANPNFDGHGEVHTAGNPGHQLSQLLGFLQKGGSQAPLCSLCSQPIVCQEGINTFPHNLLEAQAIERLTIYWASTVQIEPRSASRFRKLGGLYTF